MNWEETVIKLNCGGILSDIEVEYYNRGAEAQAKETWEIAERKGRRDVVEWVTEQIAFEAMLPAWQAQLKVWGLKEKR